MNAESPTFVVGIDLGTTNSVVAYARLDTDQPNVELLAIPQLVAESTVESRTSLPSFYYAAHTQQAAKSLDLPWDNDRSFAVGEIARTMSAEAPQRTVGAAKSWLCHSRVDRRQPILPWNAPDDVAKVSPVTATQTYLEHLIDAWNDANPNDPLAKQNVVLTVPASFDPAARELTREAAIAAGLPDDLLLLEEPQAAVYSWLATVGDDWRKKLTVGNSLMICDVGGGTTDLTLIDVADENGELVLQRRAVGDHLLVGGDNMDLALAHHAANKLTEKGVKLDAWQSVSLWHAARQAKEQLLAADGPDSHPISVLGRGSRVIGGTVSIDLPRDEVVELLVDGFMPRAAIDEKPHARRASGFQEIGLPYEQDTAITRHVAGFLSAHGENSPAMPSHLLFNGGVFKADALRQRLLDVVSSWGDTSLEILDEAEDLDDSVARGAAFYGWSKENGGVRIRGGVARSYYVGIETAGLAIPGAPRPLNALCVVPFGMEEGTEADVPSNEFGLVLGEPAEFRFFSSTTRQQDAPGNMLQHWTEEELRETDTLEATLPADPVINEPYVPVQFQSKITELGMFELWCVSTKSDKRWKLEFNVRDE